MKRLSSAVKWCLLGVASSFWVHLGWAYFTSQSKDSYYVGPAVAAWGIVFLIDSVLCAIGLVCGVKALARKEITLGTAAIKWSALVLLIGLSFYLQVQVDMYLHPFFRR